MKLCAIVVNYRIAAKTLDSLAYLMDDLAGLNASVVIVDNDSQDGSEAQLRERVQQCGWGERVLVVQAGRNGGFGAGNNVGIHRALQFAEAPDYFLLINPDAYPKPGTCEILVEFMDAHSQAGILGAAIYGVDGTAQCSAFRFPSILSEFEGTLKLGIVSKLLADSIVAPPFPLLTTRTDWVSGSCMLIRRQVFESVGMFDERFFLYFEEIDLCRRALEAGWHTYWVREANIVHDEGYATKIQDANRPRPKYWFDSRSYYYCKNHGRLFLWAANLAWLGGSILWQVRCWIQRRPTHNPPHLIWHFIKYSFRTS